MHAMSTCIVSSVNSLAISKCILYSCLISEVKLTLALSDITGEFRNS